METDMTIPHTAWLYDHLRAIGPQSAAGIHAWAREQGVPRATVVRFLASEWAHRCPDYSDSDGYMPGTHRGFCRPSASLKG